MGIEYLLHLLKVSDFGVELLKKLDAKIRV